MCHATKDGQERDFVGHFDCGKLRGRRTPACMRECIPTLSSTQVLHTSRTEPAASAISPGLPGLASVLLSSRNARIVSKLPSLDGEWHA